MLGDHAARDIGIGDDATDSTIDSRDNCGIAAFISESLTNGKNRIVDVDENGLLGTEL